LYGIWSGTLTSECGQGGQLYARICRAHSCGLSLFLFRPGSSTVNVRMCIVSVFDGNGMVYVDDNQFGPAVQFPVRCWDELLENLPGLVLGERWLLALLASRHLFSGPGWCRHVCLIALRKRAHPLCRCALYAARWAYPPFWSTVQALQARPRNAHILLAGAGVGGAAFANTHA
jgi:hypothetical protein